MVSYYHLGCHPIHNTWWGKNNPPEKKYDGQQQLRPFTLRRCHELLKLLLRNHFDHTYCNVSVAKKQFSAVEHQQKMKH